MTLILRSKNDPTVVEEWPGVIFLRRIMTPGHYSTGVIIRRYTGLIIMGIWQVGRLLGWSLRVVPAIIYHCNTLLVLELYRIREVFMDHLQRVWQSMRENLSFKTPIVPSLVERFFPKPAMISSTFSLVMSISTYLNVITCWLWLFKWKIDIAYIKHKLFVLFSIGLTAS